MFVVFIMLYENRRNNHNDLLHCSTHPLRMLPLGSLSYNLRLVDWLDSNQRHLDYKSKEFVITAADYVMPLFFIPLSLQLEATLSSLSQDLIRWQ